MKTLVTEWSLLTSRKLSGNVRINTGNRQLKHETWSVPSNHFEKTDFLAVDSIISQNET